jgi:hypothetical protein
MKYCHLTLWEFTPFGGKLGFTKPRISCLFVHEFQSCFTAFLKTAKPFKVEL